MNALFSITEWKDTPAGNGGIAAKRRINDASPLSVAYELRRAFVIDEIVAPCLNAQPTNPLRDTIIAFCVKT
ncbi:hypothetical protein M514_22822 [Trichuris suis]|uniref:Uncharacterized protein n=1 Tax=Trichuris suis TaxID=68888 RepID=A0A085N675_9BILA|nr:hypothetical protein M514_22820 [Trichuris suis]KFD64973.1 hypothetical protein M514_22822 [Trichuris suis]